METNKNFLDEINFKSIFQKPLKLFGWVFPFFFILILVLGIYFAQNLNQISFNELNPGLNDTTNIKKEIVEKRGIVIPPVNFEEIKNPTKEIILKGKELFDSNCKSCHGENGLGDGIAGANLNPKPRNFHLKEGWTNGRTIDAMYKTLQEGIPKNGMPSYDFLSPIDRFSIILYIRTLADFPSITDDQLKNIDNQYNISKGKSTPNQIPVEKAINILVKENSLINEKIKSSKNMILISNDVGARLIVENANDIEKIITTFLSNENISFPDFKQVIKVSQNMGFKPSICRLNDSELELVYKYLRENIK